MQQMHTCFAISKICHCQTIQILAQLCRISKISRRGAEMNLWEMGNDSSRDFQQDRMYSSGSASQ